MKFSRLMLFVVSGMLIGGAPDDAKKTVMDILKKQEGCWNRGDIDGFMENYWKSEDLVFVTKDAVTYGWQATIDRYKRRYPTQKEMGQLTFTIIKVEPLTDLSMFMIGKWHLEREGLDNLEGHFSLIWRKVDGTWVVVADHSS